MRKEGFLNVFERFKETFLAISAVKSLVLSKLSLPRAWTHATKGHASRREPMILSAELCKVSFLNMPSVYSD